MLKVLLINPPRTHFPGSIAFDLHFPLGLMYIAAAIRDSCNVEIFDCLSFEGEKKENDGIIFGASPEDICKVISEKKPDIVGISVHATAQYRNAEFVAKISKEVNPKIITVFGGPDPSVRYKEILENQYCDYCVVGDGEETFHEFIQNFDSPSSIEKIKGLAYKKDGIAYFKPRLFEKNLDALPFPAFDLVDINRYLKNKKFYKIRSKISKKSASIITSRGCPNRCVFCSVRLHMGQKYRAHSPEYVVRLLRLCIEKYGITNFHFEDDNLTYDKQRFERILDLIIEENLQIQWDTPNGVRVDTLDYNLLDKMKKSGCVQLTFAIESGNQRVLNEIIHKGLNLKNAVKIVMYCHKIKIPVNAFYVIGFPGETLNEIKDTVNLATKLYSEYDMSPILMVATPLYGTELYEICVREKIINGDPTCEDYCVAIQPQGESLISTRDFSKEDIKKIIREYKKQIRPKYIRYILKHPQKLIASH